MRILTQTLLLLLLLVPGMAQAEVEKGPKPKPVEKIDFPEFQEKVLDNGLRVVVVEHHEQPAVSLRLVLPAGRAYEGAGKAGISQAVAGLLTEGTDERSAQEVAAAIDYVGGTLNAGSGWDSAFVSASVTSDQVDLGLELLADVVRTPAFAEEEIERWRTQALNALQVQFTDADYLAGAAFLRTVFGDHPYGYPGGGTPDSVRTFTQENFAAFHKAHYLPTGSILAVVGDVKPAQAFKKVEKAFGDWQKGEAPTAPTFEAVRREGHQLLVIDKPDAVQTEIRVGHAGLAYGDPDAFVGRIYNSVLGGSSTARLFEEIRGERGLTYGAYSSLSLEKQPGAFTIDTFTKTESTKETLDVLFDVVEGLAGETVPADELRSRKTYLTGAAPLALETPDGIATRVLDALEQGFGREYLESYTTRLDAVTAEQVKAFAEARIQPQDTVIVLAGNASEFLEAVEKDYGKAEVIALSELDLLQPDLRRAKADMSDVSEADRTAALEMMGKARKAMGGEAFMAQTSLVLRGTGTLQPPGVPQPMEIPEAAVYQVIPEKFRVEMALPFGQLIQAFNGEEGWVKMGPQITGVSDQLKEQSKYGSDLLRSYDQDGYVVRPLGEVELAEQESRKAVGVAVSDSEGRETRFYLDPESHLLLQVAFETGGQQTVQVYGDYQDVSGVQVAHHQIAFQNGTKLMGMTVTEAEVNSELDPGLFEKPEG